MKIQYLHKILNENYNNEINDKNNLIPSVGHICSMKHAKCFKI